MRQTGLSTASLVECSEGILFGKPSTKLPAPPFLGFDEVLEVSDEGGRYGHGYAIARKCLVDYAWIFASHFKGDPVLPGTVMLEGLLQLSGFYGAYVGCQGSGRAGRIDGVKFLTEVTPDCDEVIYRIDVRRASANKTLLVTEGVAYSKDKPCISADNLWLLIKPAKQCVGG